MECGIFEVSSNKAELWYSSKMKYLHGLCAWELQLFYRFMWRDIPAAVLPGVAFTLVAVKHHGSTNYVPALLWSLFYFCLYIYTFNLCNQYTGVEEDRINKPDRPIPSGLVSVEGARFRWYIVTVLYIVAGLAIGNVWSSLLWIFDTIMHNHYGWSEHWFTKNSVFIPLGTVVQGWAGWSVATGDIWLDQESVVFIGMAVLYACLLVNLQDFRDVEGDRKVGRKTMPVQFGLASSTYMQSFLFFLQFVMFYSVIFSTHTPTLGQLVLTLFNLVLQFDFIACLLLMDRTPADYHHTYHSFTKHYFCLCIEWIAYL